MAALSHPLSSIVVLGGSFDPPHDGHVAVAHYLAILFIPDELRILPAGNPWQKAPLLAAASHRVEMAKLAFRGFAVPVRIDTRETIRPGPTYTVETLRELRAELGGDTALVLAMGADQLMRLNTWRDWRSIFELAHVCIVPRPGFSTAPSALPEEIRTEVERRLAPAPQLRFAAAGLCCIGANLSLDVSATDIRRRMQAGSFAELPVPSAVLDYIQHHQLYRT